jgi:hypothetical protein
MSAVIDILKQAGELIERAAELLRQAATEPSLPSQALRQSAGKEIARIRLSLMLLRRNLTILHDSANHRKPRVKGREKEE